MQRVHAVLFHQGAPVFHDLSQADAPQQLAALAREHLSPAGQQQIGLYLRMLEVTEAELNGLRRQLVTAARHLHGAKVLAGRPLRGRAVHRARADLLAGRRGPVLLRAQGGPVRRPGHHRLLLRRQALARAPVPAGPAGAALGGLRGRQDPRPRLAPDHRYYATVKDRKDGKRAALSEARKIIRQACHILAELGDDALAMV